MTTIFDAQDALKLALENRIVGVPVSLGYPAGGIEGTHVWVGGDVTAWSVGPHEFDDDPAQPEGYTLEVRIIVFHRGVREFTDVRDRLKELIADVLAALESDTTLGGVVERARLAGGRIDEAPVKEGRQAGAVLQVQVNATVE